MVEVKIGDTLRDNDPRNHGTTVKVEGLLTDGDLKVTHVVYRGKLGSKGATRANKIKIERIQPVGYKGQKGWTLVPA